MSYNTLVLKTYQGLVLGNGSVPPNGLNPYTYYGADGDGYSIYRSNPGQTDVGVNTNTAFYVGDTTQLITDTTQLINFVVVSFTIGNLVTTIGNSAFSGWNDVTFIIPASVTSIGQNAFLNCINLTITFLSVNIPTIGTDAFKTTNGRGNKGYVPAGTTQDNQSKIVGIYLNGGQTIVLPNPPTPFAPIVRATMDYYGNGIVTWKAPYNAGYDITGYTITSIPSSSTVTVGPDVRTTTINILNNVNYTFYVTASNVYGTGSTGDSESRNIVVLNSYIGTSFINDGGYTYYGVNSDGQYIYASALGVTTIIDNAFDNSLFYITASQTVYSYIVSFTTGNLVTSLGQRSFSGCGSMYLIISGSVTTIGTTAFRYNAGFRITFKSVNIPTIGGDAFRNTDGVQIYVPYGTTTANKNKLVGWTVSLSSIVELPNPPTPLAPTVEAVLNYYGNVTVTWTAPYNVTGYNIGGYTLTSIPPSSTLILGPNVRTTTIKKLTNGTFTFYVTASNQFGTGLSGSSLPITNSYPCFLIGSKILTDKGYLPIEKLRKGHLVKTLKHGFLPIVLIGKSPIYNSGDKERIKNRLYNLSTKKYNELTEDLVLTGCHSLLVDILTKEQEDATLQNYGEFNITDSKVRLETYLDLKSEPYSKEGTFTIYHLALENENYFSNYGIWANGLLVETCSKRYLTEFSGMELIN